MNYITCGSFTNISVKKFVVKAGQMRTIGLSQSILKRLERLHPRLIWKSDMTRVETIRGNLSQLVVGSCSCNTKTPDIIHHRDSCNYRIIKETQSLFSDLCNDWEEFLNKYLEEDNVKNVYA
jgi:hypothetical protein